MGHTSYVQRLAYCESLLDASNCRQILYATCVTLKRGDNRRRKGWIGIKGTIQIGGKRGRRERNKGVKRREGRHTQGKTITYPSCTPGAHFHPSKQFNNVYTMYRHPLSWWQYDFSDAKMQPALVRIANYARVQSNNTSHVKITRYLSGTQFRKCEKSTRPHMRLIFRKIRLVGILSLIWTAIY
ncbi:hypothetical protein PUN28_002013 [Cardiocondyla obscurior]|uniref:Ribosomal protein L15 n=1 Tax=Cardiocondyla obscurior TaxID=286306 RepID=A0AAW2GSE3_9HYME